MRIISWNIRAGGGQRAEPIAEQIRAWRPQLVALSEFRGTPPSQRLASRLRAAGFVHQLTTVDPDRLKTNALLLASVHPLDPIELPTGPAEPQRWLLARVNASSSFLIGVMHIPNYVSGKKYPYHDAVLSVAESWTLGPGLFIGDTNTGLPGIDEETPIFRQREKRWIESLAAMGWVDVFRHLKGDERVFTWYSPNGGNGFRLDQAFVNEPLLPCVTGMRYQWGGESNGAINPALSDHAAIILDLAPPASREEKET